jgi:type I restriction enzyme R subunit
VKPPRPAGTPARRKLVVDGTPVEICAEVVYELDPNGRQVKPVQYTDYSALQVRTLYSSADTLRSKWSSAEERAAVVEALEKRGVSLEQLAEVTRKPEAEALDLLLHLAWGAPLKTRRERADRVKREHRKFFERFRPEARQILDQLVEKYAQLGIRQLDDLQILEVPPLSTMGTSVEIVTRFGGPEQLKKAIGELQRLIYAA